MKSLIIPFLCFFVLPLNAYRVQRPERLSVGDTNVRNIQDIDEAAWIWHPRAEDGRQMENGFFRFENVFSVVDREEILIDVSADERFELFLNGKLIGRGPDRGVPEMWFYHTYSVVVPPGTNILEAIVWRLGEVAPLAQHSLQGGFILKASGVLDDVLTTGKGSWRVARLDGVIAGNPRFSTTPTGAQFTVIGDSPVRREVPFDAWRLPSVVRPRIVAHPYNSLKAPGWQLFPSQLPEQTDTCIAPGCFVAADNQAFVTNGVYSARAADWYSNAVYEVSAARHPVLHSANGAIGGKLPMVIPANSSVRLLWDLKDYYCAYPELSVSGGNGSLVRWGWAESLYIGDCFDGATLANGKIRKGFGRRDEFAGRYFGGVSDVFVVDGRTNACFTVPWWRCGRWCQIEVKTSDEPLRIEALKIRETLYPFEQDSFFKCDAADVSDIIRLCLKGLRMCMHETYMDCPYYEQLMYAGDTRVQMLVSLATLKDDRLMRQCFRLFELSQRSDGLVSMCYPSRSSRASAVFSLFWGMMLHDYAMWRDEPEWVRSRAPAVRKLLFGIESYANEEGLIGGLPGWSFTDWTSDWRAGVAPDGYPSGGYSSIINLIYLRCLRGMSEVERFIGEPHLSARWNARAEKVANAVARHFWNEGKGLVSDTLRFDSYSEHASSLALTSGIFSDDIRKKMLCGLESDAKLTRCTVYFSHYLFDALLSGDKGKTFFEKLEPWRDFLVRDLKTPMEAPGDARSDCHGWGSHPVYHFLNGVAGVSPKAAGFRSVRVAPVPGQLRRIVARVPHPKGFVSVDLDFADGSAKGSVVLPLGVGGTFEWKGRSSPLSGGENSIDTADDHHGCFNGKSRK